MDCYELLSDLDSVEIERFEISLLEASTIAENVGDADKISNEARKKLRSARRQVLRRQEKAARQELRRQQQELSQKLLCLQETHNYEKAQFEATQPSSFFLWKAFATRQLEKRLCAEAERRQLKAIVENQSAYIQQLHDTIRKRQLQPNLTREGSNERHELPSSEWELCNVYLRELEKRYLEVDDLLVECGLASMLETEVTMRSVRRLESNGGVQYFQKVTKALQPSSFDQTDKFLWKLGDIKDSSRMRDVRHYAVGDPNFTKVFQFHEELVLLNGTKVKLLQRCFVRRFVEANRAISLWKLVAEGEGLFSSVLMVQDGCFSLRPSKDGKVQGTQVEMCQRWTPMHLCSTEFIEDIHAEVHTIADRTMKQVMASLEKQLLDDAFTSLGW